MSSGPVSAPVFAESLLDRLIDAIHQLVMDGLGYRLDERPEL